MVPQAQLTSIIREGASGKLTIALKDGRTFTGFDQVLVAIGRRPATACLNLHAAGVTVNESTGYIEVDAYQNTVTTNIYALGDVCGKVELTPMAIAAGRRLADRFVVFIFLLYIMKLIYYGYAS
jgi:glutathione reductase (NADPH)